MELNNNLKSSTYNIYVELQNHSDQELLIHGYTGAIDLISKQVANSLKNKNGADISDETKNNLEQRGYLTLKSPKEEREYVNKIVEILHRGRKRNAGFLFAVTYNCNFRCSYCYENSISGTGNKWSKHVFTKQMVDRAYQAMLEIEPDRKKHGNLITLYGGEPLMLDNYEIVKYIIEEGLKRNYNFFAVTNAYDLNHFDEFLGKGKLGGLQITLDGMKETHDKRRPHYLNNTSFDQIIKNIDFALKREVKVSLRINTDYSNFNDFEALIDLFKKKGWTQNTNFSVNSALTQNYESCTGNKSITNFEHRLERLKYIDNHHEATAINEDFGIITCQDYGIRAKLLDTIERDNYINFTPVFCAAHASMNILDPIGDIYPCWDVVGLDEHKIGSYKEGIIYYDDNYEKWRGRNVANLKSCNKCKYALFCGGGCAGVHILKGNNLNSSNCDHYPKVFEKVANNIYEQVISKKLNVS